VLPLRVATVLGLVLAAAGLVALAIVGWLWFYGMGPSYGFGWIMAALLVFSGTQLVLLGLIGEYIGRMFLAVNQRPQSIVREVLTNAAPALAKPTTTPDAADRHRHSGLGRR
jgi:undecaprenyl-phosphate 4-deoxy-4-formamido-L-arabinose transferase